MNRRSENSMKVTVTDEIRTMPCYRAMPAQELPMFAENRVHQRSSGNPYPNKVVVQADRSHREEGRFRIITLENESLKIEIMPELGGRILGAADKRTGYDFFYRQHVIKPALIGLLGNWISGGIEFNWPCHHRPSTFMPVDVRVEEETNGAVTVWLSENEPLDRMKGMVGVRLAPGEARFDTRMKVYNGTAERHSFLWWENAAVPVHEDYRLIFPPDVRYVQFHYRKNVTSYPVASGVYNGIRFGEGTDISRHGNTRNPTSFFCAETEYDYFGGYDERKNCGVIHAAPRTVSVGKKMFTWAYGQLARSWEKALTDTDGAYAELMASSYSLNQPDFAWLMPYEGRSFHQMWYPVGNIGAPKCACAEAALSWEGREMRLQASVPLKNCSILVNGQTRKLDASPDRIVLLPIEEEIREIELVDAAGRTLMRYRKPTAVSAPMPDTIPDNPPPCTLKTAQENYLTGVHALQYRDPAARPDAWWKEALKRDPDHAPSLTALAEWELNHFRADEAYRYAMRAWKAVTVRNFHPESGHLQYLIGRILEAQGRDGEAWKWHMQAAWAQDARSRALTRAAMIRGRTGNRAEMAELAEEALAEYPGNETALALLAIAKRGNDPTGSEEALKKLEKQDCLYPMARLLRLGCTQALYDSFLSDACQTALDLASELVSCGERELAAALLAGLKHKTAQTEYVRAYLTGDGEALRAAAELDTGIAYPVRAIERDALSDAVRKDPEDRKARELLGCLEYHFGNWEKAAALWQSAASQKGASYRVYRNLAVACYSHLNRRKEAAGYLDEALRRNPHDEQLLYEKALVLFRTGEGPEAVLAMLDGEKPTRDDLILEKIRALNLAGCYEEALAALAAHDFIPCEGGEHAVAEQYIFACHALGRRALREGKAEDALRFFRDAQHLPDHLGAGLWNEVLLVPHRYYEALCLSALGRDKEAEEALVWICSFRQDYFTDMHLPELPCWQALALKARRLDAPAQEMLAAHRRRWAQAEQITDPGSFKTTPFFISYMEDAAAQRRAACRWQQAMTAFAAGDTAEAERLAGEAAALDPTHLYAGLMRRAE